MDYNITISKEFSLNSFFEISCQETDNLWQAICQAIIIPAVVYVDELDEKSKPSIKKAWQIFLDKPTKYDGFVMAIILDKVKGTPLDKKMPFPLATAYRILALNPRFGIINEEKLLNNPNTLSADISQDKVVSETIVAEMIKVQKEIINNIEDVHHQGNPFEPIHKRV